MSLEMLDNLLQLAAVAAGLGIALKGYFKSRHPSQAMLAACYACWILALVFWLMYLGLLGETPAELSASTVSWWGYFLFLIAVNRMQIQPGEQGWKHPFAWLAALACAGFMALWYAEGLNSPVINAVWFLIFAGLAFFSARSLAFSIRKPKKPARAGYHALVLAVLLFENLLLLASLYLWPEDYLRFNAYYLFDLLLSLGLLLLAPALNRAVAA